MKTLYFDCFSGASGDMILGALIDAGADLEKIRGQLAMLDVRGYTLRADKVNKHGIMATQFQVLIEGDEGGRHGHAHSSHAHSHQDQHGHGHGHSHDHGHAQDHGHADAHSHSHHEHGHEHADSREHAQGHAHSHEHAHQPHRHLKDIVALIERAPLPEAVKAASVETFRRIGAAEAEVHGTTIEKIHFHEVGAVDSIVDIVGAHLALEQIKPERIVASPLHVGSGTVKCAHGVMPVPAPATALLLKHAPSYGGEVRGELVTPTGAALITQLAQSFGPQPVMEVEAVGTGSGVMNLPDRPNVLRVMIGNAMAMEGEIAAPAGDKSGSVTVLETNIDDMNPELIAPLMEDLFKAGARDAFITPVMMKKGRPGHLITVIADDELAQRIVTVLFRASTTLGVRMRREQRVCLEREWRPVATPWGKVRIKIGRRNGSIENTAPEYEDCARIAGEAGVPVRKVYEIALAAAVRGDWV